MLFFHFNNADCRLTQDNEQHGPAEDASLPSRQRPGTTSLPRNYLCDFYVFTFVLVVNFCLHMYTDT